MCPFVNILGISLGTFALFNVLAFLVAAIPAYFSLVKTGISRGRSFGLIATTLVAGLIGNKLYGCLETWEEFIRNPVETFFSNSGFGFYGGLLLGSLAVIVFVRMHRLPFLKTLDVVFLFLPAAQIVGRMGCFLSGDGCYGVPTDSFLGMAFPNGLLPTDEKVHPTPLYEMAIYLGIYFIQRHVYQKRYVPGMVVALYLLLADLGRFFVEFLRINPRLAMGLTAPQVIALAGMLTGVFVLIASIRRTRTTERPRTRECEMASEIALE